MMEKTMSTPMKLMLKINNRYIQFFYHKDTGTFDRYSISPIQMQTLDENAKILSKDENNYRFLTYEEIDHEDVMRFFVRECVDDKEKRKQLFNVLRRHDFVDIFIDALHELELYDDFEMVCGDVYNQIFLEWAKENGLDF